MTRISTYRAPDLSHYEAAGAQFHAVKAGGIPLVITKATEGSSYVDPTWTDLAARIRSVDLVLGGYAFLDAAPEGSQVQHFLNVAHLQKGDLQPIIDAEAVGLTAGETFAALRDLEGRGYSPILYCNDDYFVHTLGSPTRWALWLAAYRSGLPALPAVRLFGWQKTDAGHCPGVPRPCDMSDCYGDLSDYLIG